MVDEPFQRLVQCLFGVATFALLEFSENCTCRVDKPARSRGSVEEDRSRQKASRRLVLSNIARTRQMSRGRSRRSKSLRVSLWREKSAKLAGIPVGLPSDMPKTWFVALAALSKSATPRRVRLNATADHVVVPPGRPTAKRTP